ncbi:hypothetical protein [Butyrivibrio sp. AC2005]|uniref:hypothetical protein n=1 Tax=Butyrivibrio sp. AC2005 TaxID=1280672 RepID=UPI001FA7A018|nr:hypothetical protein [Butyrivibrio sp. AC2005]
MKYIFSYIIIISMRRAIYKKNPSKAIGIMVAAVLVAGALFCTGFFGTPFGKDPVSEPKAKENTENYSAPEKKEQSVNLEIVAPKDPALNQEKKSSNISASKQSNLEKAVDDLIKLTESDG